MSAVYSPGVWNVAPGTAPRPSAEVGRRVGVAELGHRPGAALVRISYRMLAAGRIRRLVWRITASGTHHGAFQGVPATGRRVTFGVQYTFRFEDGKIVERWSTLDRLSLLVQIGAVALPGAK